MKGWFLTPVLFAVLALAGCDQITSPSSADAKGSAPQKMEATPPTPGDAQADAGDANHNAVTEGEDDASRSRREKARASLGLGGK